jgi:hypothetical protein
MNSKTDSTKILLTISVGFTVIYLITGHNWAIITSLIIGLIGVFSSYLSDLIAALWMKIAWVLSFIVPNIILSIFYFLILCPVAILSRAFRKKDPLGLSDTENSTFKDKNEEFGKQSFKKTW